MKLLLRDELSVWKLCLCVLVPRLSHGCSSINPGLLGEAIHPGRAGARVCGGRAGEEGQSVEHPSGPQPAHFLQPIVGILCAFSLGINLFPNRGAAYAPIFQASLHLSDALSSLGVTKLSFRGDNVPLCAGLPEGGAGWGHGPAGGWASHVK